MIEAVMVGRMVLDVERDGCGGGHDGDVEHDGFLVVVVSSLLLAET